MKGLILPFAVLLLSFSTVSNAVSMTYDFAAEGNVHEAGYTEFDTNNHGDAGPGHSAANGLPGGLKITASDGAGGDYYPYEDGEMYLSAMTVSPVPHSLLASLRCRQGVVASLVTDSWLHKSLSRRQRKVL
jgi:hypothetical protein